ncbi:MAG: hypothetical protein JXQ90_18295 [Cyclobacteriaceae bacterium]
MSKSSQANQTSKELNYSDFQKKVDAVVGKLGLHNAAFLLDSFIDNTSVSMQETQRLEIVSRFLIMEGIKVFELQEKLFFTSGIQEYREARMACYHLIKKYTGASHAKIAEDFGLTKRNVLYSCEKCKERLSVSYFYENFCQKYDLLEKRIIHFISKLTDQKS